MNTIDFGREICCDFANATAREWLVTNGIGGYGAGTIASCLTRRYQGLLISALQPPLGRTLMVSKLEETVSYLGQEYALSTNQWGDQSISPQGFVHLERFYLDLSVPTWIYACGDARLQKQIWMEQGENTTYIRYQYLSGSESLGMGIKSLVNYRDHHGDTQAHGWQMQIQAIELGIEIQAHGEATPFYLQSDRGEIFPTHKWFYNFYLNQESARGLSDREDHLQAAEFLINLQVGESVTLTASTRKQTQVDGESAYQRQVNYIRSLIDPHHPNWIQQLAIAADQFVVKRTIGNAQASYSILAGYPWFGDWGRDTMISLPGLTLTTKRYEIARSILMTFAAYIDRGMLPNRFPDLGDLPEYNTVDATLWYFEAIYQYYLATQDQEFIRAIYPLLLEIVQYHEQGTRYGIQVDSEDGLLRAGEPGVQLTWMDAKVGDWVVTPRTGKPIEVNALWFNALNIMASISQSLGQPQEIWRIKLATVKTNFQRFWNEDLGYCYDVLDTPEGDDPSLRPNQIFGISLSFSPLSLKQSQAIVKVCGRELLTSFGLRSISFRNPAYISIYRGGVWERDRAYHQGTVWGWLLGHFALAHFRVFGDRELAQSFLLPMQHHLSIHGLGTMSEIFDGAPPHQPGGCYAQAWTVAEVLRVWQILSQA